MPIIYSLVAQGTAVICEHTHPNHQGNFSQITRKILEKIHNQGDSKVTYLMEGHTFNFRICGNYIFMCMADEDFGRNMPFVYLKELSDEFFRMYKDNTPSSYGAFQTVLVEVMKQYSTSDEHDTVAKIQKGLDEVKDVMKMNINKVLQRSDQIEVLVDKTSQMDLTAESFRYHSRALKKNLCWQNLKMKLLTILLIVIVCYFLAAGFCGFTLSGCL